MRVNNQPSRILIRTSSANLLAGRCDSDDDTLSPALVAGFECRPHHTHVAPAVESVVAASVCHLDQMLLDALSAQLGRIDKVGRAEFLAPSLLAVVDVDDYDLSGAVLYGALDYREADAPSAKDSNIRALLYARSHHCSAVPCGDTAAEEAGTVHWRFGCDGYD